MLKIELQVSANGTTEVAERLNAVAALQLAMDLVKGGHSLPNAIFTSNAAAILKMRREP
jgi:hypothetical protein